MFLRTAICRVKFVHPSHIMRWNFIAALSRKVSFRSIPAEASRVSSSHFIMGGLLS
jgi:hypothetical protein